MSSTRANSSDTPGASASGPSQPVRSKLSKRSTRFLAPGPFTTAALSGVYCASAAARAAPGTSPGSAAGASQTSRKTGKQPSPRAFMASDFRSDVLPESSGPVTATGARAYTGPGSSDELIVPGPPPKGASSG